MTNINMENKVETNKKIINVDIVSRKNIKKKQN